MKDTIIRSGFMLLCLFFFCHTTAGAEDLARGELVFKRCMACHYVDQDKNRVGPSLQNIMGRQAGTRPGYKYSPAMVKAGEEGLIWNKENLIKYLPAPQAMVPGTRMIAVKIKSEQDVDALIDYIEKVSKETDQGVSP